MTITNSWIMKIIESTALFTPPPQKKIIYICTGLSLTSRILSMPFVGTALL